LTGVSRALASQRLWHILPRLLKGVFRHSADAQAPLRADLFSAEQMELHGQVLAQSHHLAAPGRAADQLLLRLADNSRTLTRICLQLSEVSIATQRVTPAGEWLLDNFHLIQEQIHTSRRHLPAGYSQQLPRLAHGPSAGHPRVYDIALEIISHGDGRIDPEGLARFVAAYQSVTDLRLGELWAIPIMLRLAAIENLRRVAVRIAVSRDERNLAEAWADSMSAVAESDPKSLILVIADMARSNPPMVSAFVAELARRLQGRGPAWALPLTWIEQRLAESGRTIDQMVQTENQRQASDQVSVSNSIASLRILSAINWRDFVEAQSVVEQSLRSDPGGVYLQMDFATRDRYRHQVEALARRGPSTERQVAQQALELARAALHSKTTRSHHVGYYLIDRGFPQLERALGLHPSLVKSILQAGSRSALPVYLGAVFLLSSSFSILLLALAWTSGLSGYLLLPVALATVLLTSQTGLGLVNWFISLMITPQLLPRLDFSAGIPASARTLVVVPTLISSEPGIDALLEALEVRFLANIDGHLHFALLTDFCDAASENLAEDSVLLQHAQHGVRQLNLKYPPVTASGGSTTFFLLHRPRCWNPHEMVWMGRERKRGKLEDLNSLLRSGDQSPFSLLEGALNTLSTVKYVITLDTDTQLPRDSARQLVAAMAHPLNQPGFDPEKRRVTEGYAILQPRVAGGMAAANRSLYARLYAGETGLDPYTRASSDVYQDLFGEGSFIGKGIYDVAAFEQVLGDRLPENRILSHDLLEGCYARSGLLSDVQLVEDYPASYRADVARRYRWIRGDWQLAAWLWLRVPDLPRRARSVRALNPLSALSRWKLFDNLRRSLVPGAMLFLLLTGWFQLSHPGLWLLSLLACLWLAPACATLFSLVSKSEDLSWLQQLAQAGHSAKHQTMLLGFELACLPFEALFALEAIVRTVWRMRVSQRHLLEWISSSELERAPSRRDQSALLASCCRMWFAPSGAILLLAGLCLQQPGALAAALPLGLLWLLAPLLAWWISRPYLRPSPRLNEDQSRFLRLLARRTWSFFEHFVTREEQWLPPDNVQQSHGSRIAHRTSPTNIGLALLANLAAYDFGYLTAGSCLKRCNQTLDSMLRLPRFRGHFYNWYHTQTLEPLPPLYISTVDSGNLAGHLLTLQTGLQELADAPLINPFLIDGLEDALQILASLDPQSASELRAELDPLRLLSIDELPAMYAALLCLTLAAERVGGLAQDVAQQSRAALDELVFLAPWIALTQPWSEDSSSTLCRNWTLRQLTQLPHSGAPCSDQMEQALETGRSRAAARLTQIEQTVLLVHSLAQMEYDFLYDHQRHLLAIGYNASEHRLDSGCYDLLASEARLGCFVAIAQGAIPQESWFALGRLLVHADGDAVLLSWSGSMFEYLMPLLVMPNYANTLLDQTYKAVVARQIGYGIQCAVPWGVSESGYNLVDQQLNYQYHAFGVPGLGLKRGLAEDLVIAPYASVMALMVDPEAASQNLQRLADNGVMGTYGLFEAVDYSQARQPRGQSGVIVRSYMAHHQGMSLLSLVYLLREQPMQRRFAANPLLQASMLLLQERVPRASIVHKTVYFDQDSGANSAEQLVRVFASANTPVPEVQLLSNGRYHVMVTNAGGGYSRWNNLAVTRWQEDASCDTQGSFCYIRDCSSGAFWSSSHQPVGARPERYQAIFSEGRAEFRRTDSMLNGNGSFETHTEIVVSPEDDIELRRVHISNRSRLRCEIEITSYAEVALATPAADALHPVFSHLFVQTSILPLPRAILCTRRPDIPGQSMPWMLHLVAVHGAETSGVSYETDRLRFLGRNGCCAAPYALSHSGALSGTEGSVLDPVVAIRCVIVLEAEQSVTVDVVTGMADSQEQALSLVNKYQDRHLADRVLDLAWTHSQVVLSQLNASEAEAQLYGRLANAVVYANGALRADPAILRQNHRGQSALWSFAISGDLPIVLVQIGNMANIELVRQMVQAHAYWRLKGLAVDLVIWNEDRDGYRKQLQDQIMGLISSGDMASSIDRPGGIFVRSIEQIPHEDRILLQSVARAVISDHQGTLQEQLDRRVALDWRAPRFIPTRPLLPALSAHAPVSAGPLILHNGLGGFSPDGREYVISLAPGETTPAPWVNVLANAGFGTVISASGSAYTWGDNAHEYRLTPWHNDPVCDPSGEALYLRDEETGRVWCPTPLPLRASTPFVVRHGFGYSVFETCVDGLRSELWVYVATDAAVKFSLLKIFNLSGRKRRLSATGFVEWVLGDLRARSALHVQSEIEAHSGALYARNVFNPEFADRVAFFDVDDPERMLTADRTEFLGRNGSMGNPAAMKHAALSGKVGAGLDPAAAMQMSFELADGQQHELVFRLGMGQDTDDASRLVSRFRGVAAAHKALDAVRSYWTQTLAALRIDTPDPAVNVLVNGWLPYQTLACRLWARSGFYQSGGAFGFRDQLQDVMALVQMKPDLVRAHLLLCASRQFVEGDVQHWWHPPSGRGVRTRCSDDMLWLPLALCRYVSITADRAVLDETVPFLEGRPVNAFDESYYDFPLRASASASLYQHAQLAIRHALKFGDHGLPLMGSGDWNDGMNRVGTGGRGESVWLGFFLCHVLEQFADLAQSHGDQAFVAECHQQRTLLSQNLEQHGWDGAWYRRAFFDDGTLLGSASNDECRIDSIAQSWSVLSGVADAGQARAAMQAVDLHLVRREQQLVQLLDPPFDHSALDPGYIRGYVPGVRENGGQYTQAAVWAAMAFAALGDGDRAWEVFSLINPLNHARNREDCLRYKVEPYVVSADVYAVAPHTGRGGWSWYTGSAAWMYRLLLESLLGLQQEGARLHCSPCLPADWPQVCIDYRYGATSYHLVMALSAEQQSVRIVLDGIALTGACIELVDDGLLHQAEIAVPRTRKEIPSGG
jgi:cyclic beta-1,2-glucan synthetase